MNLAEYAAHDALGLAELVAKKQVSPKELAQTASAAREKIDPTILGSPDSGWAVGAASVTGFRRAGASTRLANTMSGCHRMTSAEGVFTRDWSAGRRVFLITPHCHGNASAMAAAP